MQLVSTASALRAQMVSLVTLGCLGAVLRSQALGCLGVWCRWVSERRATEVPRSDDPRSRPLAPQTSRSGVDRQETPAGADRGLPEPHLGLVGLQRPALTAQAGESERLAQRWVARPVRTADSMMVEPEGVRARLPEPERPEPGRLCLDRSSDGGQHDCDCARSQR